jgi:predicted regulator of Ras-like GTPase activity (Roadblock/LC7/MglB family)
MNEEVYAFILRSTLNEIKIACPDLSHAFVFKEDGKILARDDDTDEGTLKSSVSAFGAIAERANAMGGIESITLHGTNGRMSIACINDFYLTTIASKEADEKYVNTLTRVWVPTVLKLMEKIRSASIDGNTSASLKPEPASDNDADRITGDTEVYEKEVPVEGTAAAEPQPKPAEGSGFEVSSNSLLPEPPVSQLIVESLSGLLVPPDTVRIDSAVIMQWKDLYADRKIEEVDVENLNGKATRCKFKPVKDSKHQGKGIVQMPRKIQLTLQTTKGELVMVKPVVE